MSLITINVLSGISGSAITAFTVDIHNFLEETGEESQVLSVKGTLDSFLLYIPKVPRIDVTPSHC
jgi:hypothetical protein